MYIKPSTAKFKIPLLKVNSSGNLALILYIIWFLCKPKAHIMHYFIFMSISFCGSNNTLCRKE